MKKNKICVFPKLGKESNIQQVLLRQILGIDFHIIEGSWKSMLSKRYDLILINWPELFLHGENRYIKKLLFLVLVVKWFILNTSRICIIHNPVDRNVTKKSYTTSLLLRISNGKIFLNSTEAKRDPSDVIIPNFHFISAVRRQELNPENTYDAIAFGFLSKYKNLELAIDSFKGDDYLRLLIVGKAESNEYLTELLNRIEDSRNINLIEGFMDYPELLTKIFASKIGVFLYSDIFNSAAVMLSLSCGKPVLVTECDYAEELVQELGPHWIYTVKKDANIRTVQQTILRALHEADVRGDSLPNFSPYRELEMNRRAFREYFYKVLKVQDSQSTP
jgi:glycosyltransferase involved in cell wall biosynthesis